MILNAAYSFHWSDLLCEFDELIVLIPQQNDLDHEFPPAVSSWNEVVHYAQEESIDFIPSVIS